MKQTIKTLAVSVILSSFSVSVLAGVPVTDEAHILTNVNNQIQSWAIEAERWVERVKEFEQDFANQQAQLSSMTGVRNISGFMNEASSILSQVKNLDSWANRSQEILSAGKNILSPELRKIFDSYGLTNLCNNFTNTTQKNNCEGGIILDVVKQTQNKQKMGVIEQRVNKIQEIASRMSSAADIKETQDLNNAMQTQLALLQADKIQADLEKSQEELNQRLLEKKQSEAIKTEMLNGLSGKKL